MERELRRCKMASSGKGDGLFLNAVKKRARKRTSEQAGLEESSSRASSAITSTESTNLTASSEYTVHFRVYWTHLWRESFEIRLVFRRLLLGCNMAKQEAHDTLVVYRPSASAAVVAGPVTVIQLGWLTG